MKVSEVMTRSVVSISPDASLKEVAELLVTRQIAGLPVCTADGEVVGVVSEGDVLWKETGLAPEQNSLLARILTVADGHDRRLDARTAGQAMTSPAITISPEATVAHAAKLMIDRQVNRLPVVADGKLVGIVARSDLVRAFVRSDESIEREISEDILTRTLWIDAGALTLSVEDGDVTIEGRVDNRSAAELAVAYIRRIPGVVSVTSRLTWAVDDQARRTVASADQLPHRL